jgi:hypothetical protein
MRETLLFDMHLCTLRAPMQRFALPQLEPAAACGIVHLVRYLEILPSPRAQADGSWMKERWAPPVRRSMTEPGGIVRIAR